MGLFDNLKSGLSSAGSALNIKTTADATDVAASTQTESAFCKQCGAPLLPGATFCGKCGASQAGATKAATTSKVLPDYVFPDFSWNEVADRILADRRFPSELWDLAGSVSKPHEIQISDVIGFCNISNCDAFIVRGGGSLSLDDLALELIDVAEDHDRSSLKIKIDRDITRGGGITIAANVPDPESPIEANPFNLIVQEVYGDDAIFYYYRIRKTDHRVFVGPDAFGRTDCVVAMTFARLNSKGGEPLRPVPWIVDATPLCNPIEASLTEAINENSDDLLAQAAGFKKGRYPSPIDGVMRDDIESYTILDPSVNPYQAVVELGHRMGQEGWKIVQGPDDWYYGGDLIQLAPSGADMGKQWWDTLVVRVEAKTRGYILYLIPLYNLFNQAYGLRKEGKMLRPDMEAAFQAVAPFADQMFDFLEAAKHTFIYAVAQINQEAANRCGISLDSKRSLPRGSFDEFLQACQAGEHEKASKLDNDLTTLQFRLYDDPLADKRFCASYVVPLAVLGLESLARIIQNSSSIGPLVARVVDRPDGREGDQLIEVFIAEGEEGKLWQKGCHWFVARGETADGLPLLNVFLSSCEMDKAIAKNRSGAVLPPDVKALLVDCAANSDRVVEMTESVIPPVGLGHVIRLLNSEWLSEKSQSQD